MPHENELHGACVDAWLAAEAAALSPSERRQLFERALGSLWRRARRTLGDVTLGAIFDRVLFRAIESFPLLAALEHDGDRIRWGGPPPEGELACAEELAAGRFALVELLTIVGILTGGILVPALRAELASVKART